MFGFASKILALFLIAMMANYSLAQDQESSASADPVAAEIPATAHATVELVSEQLIGMIGDAKQRFEEDPDGFYADIESVISPWMDFGYWSKVVMGQDYASQATEEQLENFEAVFRASLVQTYAKGMISVEDSGFEVKPPLDGDESKSTVIVTQILYAGSDKIELVYGMKKNDQGRWQVLNVLLEGVNLRKTFQSQFKNAALEHEGDLDEVIQSWGA